MLVGRWLRCGPALWADGGEGIQFEDDGTFRLLQRDRQGKIVPGSGFDAQGTWTLGGRGRDEARLVLTREASISVSLRFTQGPVKMRMTGRGVPPRMDWVRVAHK